MTRKDYIAHAEHLRAGYNSLTTNQTRNQWEIECLLDGFMEGVLQLTDIFAEDNPRFDMNRFLRYITNE